MLNDAYTTPYGYSSVNNVSDKYEISNYSSFHFDDVSLYSTPSAAYENNVTNTTLEITFILPVWRQVLWTLLFVCMVIVATVGNLVVIWIVLANKRMRTVTNYFLVNLSIADAMVSTLNVTFNYTYMLNLDWPFGTLYCKISQFVAILSICASVFTLMAISIDRYMAIMNPLRPRMGKRATLCIAAAIWIVGIIISSPMLLFFTTFELQDRVVCYSEWPDGPSNHSMQEYVYNVIFMFLTYFLPIGSMSFTYARVGLELWGSKSIGECTQRQLENIKSKRRVVKMMMVVVVIFAVCWLPFQIYFIATSYYPELTDKPYIQEVYLGIYWLAMSNSMYNPIIYCWMNSRFRRGFQQFFRWCPFIRISPDVLTRRGAVNSRYSCSGSPDHHRIVRNDTERSILYTCPGSPKTQRRSQGSVHIPMHLSTCQHHPATSSTSFSQKLPPRNESFPTRSNTVTSSNGHRILHHSYHHHHHQHQLQSPKRSSKSNSNNSSNSPSPALISSNLNSFKNNSALGTFNNDDISNSADNQLLS
ncbi:tachykinin-like peptides receptor 99D [Aedes aegypti]|uniref:G-protein coupled receptors family 1 profile domain-containing protein n=1 Tax=Aedes aegypti TaxID=7159 RepID=A0A1S4FFA1_AEDAE|nr:tachykinin-like peptides receptor 99D [Aedes aegypti]